jgi:hypothetical protein
MTRLAAISIFLFGCNSSSPSPFFTADASADSRASSDAPSAPSHQGEINVEMTVPYTNGDPASTTITGELVLDERSCMRTSIPPCEVVSCPPSATEMLADPGMLHVGTPTGGDFGTDPGEYPIMYTANEVPWGPGDAIPVHTDGSGTAPALSATLTTPVAIDAGFTGPVYFQHMSRSAPLHVTWIAASGDVDIVMVQAAFNEPTTTITCTFDGSAGAGDIPADVTAKLVVSTDAAGIGDTHVHEYAAENMTITAGSFAVDVRALRGYYLQEKWYEVQ